MRSVGSVEEGVSASIIDSHVSGRPLASVVCEEPVPTEADDNVSDSGVNLPPRYMQRLLCQKGKSVSSAPHKVADDLDSREKDLGVALTWIRQEILQMKAQDKSLMKQFIELRAKILQLRCMYQYHSSNSDISSLEGSTVSLNDATKRRVHKTMKAREGDFLDLSARTKSLLSLPENPKCTTIKWRSDEFV